MKEGSGENENVFKVSLLSVSVRSYGQNKTIYNFCVPLWDPFKACAQNGISGSYMNAVFELVMQKESVIGTGLSYGYINQGRLNIAPRLVAFV